MRRYLPYQQIMEPGAGRSSFPSAEGTIPEEATHYNVASASSQQQVAHSFPAAGSSLLNLGVNSKRKQLQMEYTNNESSRPRSSEEFVDAEDEMRVDGRKPQQRKKVSEMSPDERLQWSRIQSRDHSRRSRQRRKKIEEDLRVEVEQLQSFRTLIEESYQLVSIQSVSPECKFLYANSVWFRALNYIPQDLIGVSILDVCFEEDREALNTAINRFISVDGDASPYHSVDWRIISRKTPENGTMHCVTVSSSMSINQQGLVIFSMIRDDTTISLAPRSPSNSVVRSERTLTEPGAAVDSATLLNGNLFGMGATGAGPRRLAEARHESAFRHWQTAAMAAPVRHQGHAKGEAEVFGYRRVQETEQRRALFNAETDAEET